MSHLRSRPARMLLAASVVSLVLAGLAGGGNAGAYPDEATYVPPPVTEPGPVGGGFTRGAASKPHEVWLVDQSNTDSAQSPTFGGRIYIYDGAQLRVAASAAEAEVVELSAETSALCHEQTGAYPVRPHMLYFNSSDSHAVLSFVVSGHVVVLDAESRAPLACFRTEVGAGGARQAHVAVPTPDDRFILVANQNGKKVERIRTDYATNTFSQDPSATIDLTTGVTPHGELVQSPGDASLRPDNAPICLFVSENGFPAFISLRGGGLFALDPEATPMSIVAEYPATEVARDGCGFTQAAGWVYGNGGRPVGSTSGWFVYRVPVGGPGLWSPETQPPIEVVDQDPRGPRDAHGVVTVRDRYVWAFDRSAHVMQAYQASSADPGKTLNLRSQWSQAPAPDIVAAAPDGFAVYAATRGTFPFSGAHAAAGDAPGLLLLEVRKDGREGVVRGHVAVSNVVERIVNGVTLTRDEADPHGIAVRLSG